MRSQTDIAKDNLQQLGWFSPDDLIFNQNGEMSPHQILTVRRFTQFWFICLGIYLILMIAMSGMAVWIGLLEHHIAQYFNLIVFWALIEGIFGFASYQYARPYLLDLEENRVQQVIGVIHKYRINISPNRFKMPYCSIEVKGQRFAIPQNAYTSLVDHHGYRVFYLPNSRKVVNLVPF